jgi:hypothetical protein
MIMITKLLVYCTLGQLDIETGEHQEHCQNSFIVTCDKMQRFRLKI